MNKVFYMVFTLICFTSCKQKSNADFEKSLQNKSIEDIYKLASDLYDRQQDGNAIIAFQKCIEGNYRMDTCYFKQGVCYINSNQSQIGVGKLEEAIKLNPNYFKAYFNIGATCYTNKEYRKSVEFYQKAAEIEPDNSDVYYGIAASQLLLGEIRDAEKNCQTALKFNANNDLAKTLLKQIHKIRADLNI